MMNVRYRDYSTDIIPDIFNTLLNSLKTLLEIGNARLKKCVRREFISCFGAYRNHNLNKQGFNLIKITKSVFCIKKAVKPMDCRHKSSIVSHAYRCYNELIEDIYKNSMIKRNVFDQIKNSMFKRRVILLFGTRRVGKTTLLEELIHYYQSQGKICKYMNCDTVQDKQSLETTNSLILGDIIKGYDILAIDEAQNVKEIGKTLKIIHDTFPQVQVIATGSSSFDLANKIGEPLVGRMREFLLYPFSTGELRESFGALNTNFNIEKFLRFGFYPCIYDLPEKEAKIELGMLVNGYLYRDLLTFDGVKNSSQVLRLLQCLALQVGSEVSFNELATHLEITANTVKKYIDLLEKCYVIFTLPAFSRNARNEIAGNRSRKIYFYDVGLINALIVNYQSIDIRPDAGGLWENFCIAELKKKAQMEEKFSRFYFWRTYEGKEIDLIEEEDGAFDLYEFKLSLKKQAKIPKEFAENYNVKSFNVINKENWYQFF